MKVSETLVAQCDKQGRHRKSLLISSMFSTSRKSENEVNAMMEYEMKSGFKRQKAKELSSNFLDPSEKCESLALILLNWELPNFTPLLWERATIAICADGGANRLHDEMPKMFPDESPDSVRLRFRPKLVKGDLDSVRPDVKAFYEQLGVPFINLAHDQDSTDLQKCISYIENLKVDDGMQIDTIVAVGALGGRLDHVLGNLSTLYTFRHLNLILCGDGNMARLVPSGSSVVKPYRKLEGPSCGLVPLAGPAITSTHGLRWNTLNSEMHMGGLVSTSNVLEEDQVLVHTNRDLVWTTKLDT